MPIKKSAYKHLRQTKKRTTRNRQIKTNIKQTLVNLRKTIVLANKTKAPEIAAQAIKFLDKAAQKGIIKKNNAARRKSRLMKKVNALLKSKDEAKAEIK